MIGDQRNRALAAEIDIGLVDHHRGVGMIFEQLGDLRARQRDAGRRFFVAWLWCPSTSIRTRNRHRLRSLCDRPQWDLTSVRQVEVSGVGWSKRSGEQNRWAKEPARKKRETEKD